jgi:hypothetical protein
MNLKRPVQANNMWINFDYCDMFDFLMFYTAVQADSSSSSNIDLGIVAGTAAGTVVVVALIIAIAAVLLCKKRSVLVSEPSGYEAVPLDPSAAASGTVYLSYACDSDLHRERVRQVVIALRLKYGIECLCYEHYQEEAREQFVFNWVAHEIEAASAVIVICSPQYKEITDSHTETDESDTDDVTVSEGIKRTRAEWRHIRSHAFTAGTNRCIPVFIDEIQAQYLPLDLATAGPLCWPQDEELIVDRLHSFIARRSDPRDSCSDDMTEEVE